MIGDDSKRRGQVLVLVALSLLVLILFVALAVDVGNFYAQRRRMQNAADAGALAGAQELCFGDPDDAGEAAYSYAVTRNGAQTADIQVHEAVSVTVIAGRAVPTIFAGVIGLQEVQVSAEAAALCGKAQGAGRVWPLAYSALNWPEDPECGDYVLLTELDAADCETWNCCVLYEEWEISMFLPCDDDWTPTYPPLDRRAWLDISSGVIGEDPCDATGFNRGNREAIDRIVGHTDFGRTCESFVGLPSCLPGLPGVRGSVWDATAVAEGEIVRIALYDPVRSSNPNPGQHTPNPEVCTLDEGKDPPGNEDRFYVTDVVCLEIDGPYYIRILERPGGPVFGGNRRKVLLAHIPCDDEGNPPPACATGVGFTTGSKSNLGDVRAVSLIE
jgi:hypothetical protein